MMKASKWVPCALGLAVILAWSAAEAAPTYLYTFQDAVTGDNNTYIDQTNNIRRWDVDAGSDDYTREVYERPQDNNFKYDSNTGRYGTTKYYQNLDIVSAKYGHDDAYMYAKLTMYGLGFQTDDGSGGIHTDTGDSLAYNYGIRIADDIDGKNGYFFRVINPASNSTGAFATQGTQGWRDGTTGANGDVGGPSGRFVFSEGGGNGYDSAVSSEDGIVEARRNGTMIELQIDYTQLGLTLEDVLALQHIEFEANIGSAIELELYLE